LKLIEKKNLSFPLLTLFISSICSSITLLKTHTLTRKKPKKCDLTAFNKDKKIFPTHKKQHIFSRRHNGTPTHLVIVHKHSLRKKNIKK